MDVADFSVRVSATEPDWSRETIRGFWDPGRKLLRAIRHYQAAKQRGTLLSLLVSRFWAFEHWFWSLVTQCEIHLNCQIGGGLMLPHPNGIVIHPASRIGPNCLIFHQVTFAGPVEVEGHCDFGAGCRVIGPLRIGQHVQVGANAVVIEDVPECSIVVGIPARVVRSIHLTN
jgi:serine O-acetyltransferase